MDTDCKLTVTAPSGVVVEIRSPKLGGPGAMDDVAKFASAIIRAATKDEAAIREFLDDVARKMNARGGLSGTIKATLEVPL
jgi:hypothetical protein